MSIDDRYKIPIDATANVHSVSAVGEQYLDLVSTGNSGAVLRDGQTITNGTVPAEIGPALDAANRGLAALPREKIVVVAGRDVAGGRRAGPGAAAAGRLHHRRSPATSRTTSTRSTTSSPTAAPILDSQVDSGDAIQRWAANLHTPSAPRPPSRTARCERAAAGRTDRRPAQRGVRRSCANRCRRPGEPPRSSPTC